MDILQSAWIWTASWDVFFKVTQEIHLYAKNRIQMSAEYNQQKHFCRHCSYQNSTKLGFSIPHSYFQSNLSFPLHDPMTSLWHQPSDLDFQNLCLTCHQIQEVLNNTVHDSLGQLWEQGWHSPQSSHETEHALCLQTVFTVSISMSDPKPH